MLEGIKDWFRFWWCADYEFCCKIAPLRLPKVASNRFMVFADEFIANKTEKYSLTTFLPGNTLNRLGLSPRRFGKAEEIHFECGGVPIPDFAGKWLPCGCQKLHRTVSWHLKTNACQKNRKLIFFPQSCRAMLSIDWV
jgi:hypothetical protein